jgi:DNA-directed RNA polymerase specialized sigma24 family protein
MNSILGLFKTSSKEIAEDLVQDTFLAAFHKLIALKVKVSLRPGCFQYSTIK